MPFLNFFLDTHTPLVMFAAQAKALKHWRCNNKATQSMQVATQPLKGGRGRGRPRKQPLPTSNAVHVVPPRPDHGQRRKHNSPGNDPSAKRHCRTDMPETERVVSDDQSSVVMVEVAEVVYEQCHIAEILEVRGIFPNRVASVAWKGTEAQIKLWGEDAFGEVPERELSSIAVHDIESTAIEKGGFNRTLHVEAADDADAHDTKKKKKKMKTQTDAQRQRVARYNDSVRPIKELNNLRFANSCVLSNDRTFRAPRADWNILCLDGENLRTTQMLAFRGMDKCQKWIPNDSVVEKMKETVTAFGLGNVHIVPSRLGSFLEDLQIQEIGAGKKKTMLDACYGDFTSTFDGNKSTGMIPKDDMRIIMKSRRLKHDSIFSVTLCHRNTVAEHHGEQVDRTFMWMQKQAAENGYLAQLEFRHVYQAMYFLQVRMLCFDRLTATKSSD